MDDAATLALLLDRVGDGREVCPDAETTAAILEGAGRFAQPHLAPLPVAAFVRDHASMTTPSTFA
jgi:hypothetical protein